MTRDKRKDKKYFESYISCQLGRIEKKEEKLNNCNDDIDKRMRINHTLINYKLDLLFAEFSAGYDHKNLCDGLKSAIDTAVEIKNLDYESLINIVSLVIILDCNYKVQDLKDRNCDKVDSDKLLNCLFTFVESGNAVWEGKFLVQKVYDDLEMLNDGDKKTIISNYLSTWYENRESSSWYESDKNTFDTYVGYWSFESAALVKVFNVEEGDYSNSEYYPTL